MSNLDRYSFETYQVTQKGEKSVTVQEYPVESKDNASIGVYIAMDGQSMNFTNNQFKLLMKAVEMYSRNNGSM